MLPSFQRALIAQLHWYYGDLHPRALLCPPSDPPIQPACLGLAASPQWHRCAALARALGEMLAENSPNPSLSIMRTQRHSHKGTFVPKAAGEFLQGYENRSSLQREEQQPGRALGSRVWISTRDEQSKDLRLINELPQRTTPTVEGEGPSRCQRREQKAPGELSQKQPGHPELPTSGLRGARRLPDPV